MNTAGTGTRSRVLPSVPVPPKIIKIYDVGMEARGWDMGQQGNCKRKPHNVVVNKKVRCKILDNLVKRLEL